MLLLGGSASLTGLNDLFNLHIQCYLYLIALEASTPLETKVPVCPSSLTTLHSPQPSLCSCHHDHFPVLDVLLPMTGIFHMLFPLPTCLFLAISTWLTPTCLLYLMSAYSDSVFISYITLYLSSECPHSRLFIYLWHVLLNIYVLPWILSSGRAKRAVYFCFPLYFPYIPSTLLGTQ